VKEELVRLLRESLPEIVGTLIAAGILAMLGAIFLGYGIVGAGIVVLLFALVVLGVLWLSARIRKPREKPPRAVPKPPKLTEPKFIRRRDEQGHDLAEEVSEALKKAALVVIWGAGGVGKTTLATEVANQLFESRYKGGVIWADADEVADFGFTSFLDEILDNLERQDARTLALDDKKRLVTRLLGEEDSRLIVVDNFEAIAAEERRRIVPFLCALPCAALVASRRWIDQAENIHLPPMSDTEALDFLKMATRNTKFASKLSESQLEKVALAADRNPLYMQWVVGQVEKARALDEVLADIKTGKGETSERIFDRSFKLLSPDGQSALLALALFVPSASRQALGVVAGFGQPGNWFQRLIGRLRPGKTPAGRLQQALEELAILALLEPRDDRLGLLRLTRELALTRLEKEGRGKELRERFIAYFLAYAEAHPEVTKEDLDALDNERENLLAALDYAYAAEDWESVIRLAHEICPPVIGLFGVRGYWDEAIKWGEQAAEAASQANLPAVAAAFSGDVGTIRYLRGDYAKAREACQKALVFFQQAGDERNVAVALHQLGMVAQGQGHYQEAKDLYNQSLEIERNLGDQAGIAKSLLQLGSIAQLQGDYQEAKDLYNQSLEIERTLGNQAGIAMCLHGLGMVAQLQGHYQEAKNLYSESLEIVRSLGDQAGIAMSLHQLGIIAQDQGHYQEAKDLYDQSLEIARSLRDQAGIAMSLHQLGIIAQLQGHYQEAKDLYDQSLEIKRNLGDQAGIASSLGQLGRLAEEASNKEEAAQLYREALVIFEKLGSPDAEKARQDLARVTGEQPKE
jgi:tetratricopeptide (TPR) repeat protein